MDCGPLRRAGGWSLSARGSSAGLHCRATAPIGVRHLIGLPTWANRASGRCGILPTRANGLFDHVSPTPHLCHLRPPAPRRSEFVISSFCLRGQTAHQAGAELCPRGQTACLITCRRFRIFATCGPRRRADRGSSSHRFVYVGKPRRAGAELCPRGQTACLITCRRFRIFATCGPGAVPPRSGNMSDAPVMF